MIKLDIQQGTKKQRPRNMYKINLEFMVGDADGEVNEQFTFNEKKLEDPKFLIYLTEFVQHLDDCIKLDRQGRGGFQDPTECVDHYQYVKNWAKFCTIPAECLSEDELEDYEGLEPYMKYEDGNIFSYDVPCQEDWYTSYRNLTIKYYDSDGEIFNVAYSF